MFLIFFLFSFFFLSLSLFNSKYIICHFVCHIPIKGISGINHREFSSIPAHIYSSTHFSVHGEIYDFLVDDIVRNKMVRYVRGTRRQSTDGTCGLYMFSHRFPWDIANAENGWYGCNIDVDIVYVLFVIFFGGSSLPSSLFLSPFLSRLRRFDTILQDILPIPTIQVARIYRCSCNFFSWRLLARYVGTRFAPIKLYGEFSAFFSFFLFSKIIDAVVSIVRGSNLRMKDRENDRIHGNPITFFTQTTKQSFQQLFMLCSCGIYKGERERKRERLSEFVS